MSMMILMQINKDPLFLSVSAVLSDPASLRILRDIPTRVYTLQHAGTLDPGPVRPGLPPTGDCVMTVDSVPAAGVFFFPPWIYPLALITPPVPVTRQMRSVEVDG